MEVLLGITESILACVAAYLVLFRMKEEIQVECQGILLKSRIFTVLSVLLVLSNGVRCFRGISSLGSLRELWIFVMMVVLLVLGVCDWQTRKVKNRHLCYLLILWLVTMAGYLFIDIFMGIRILGISIAGALFAGITFFLCYLISRGQLGGGDVKFAFLLGLYLTGDMIFGVIIFGVTSCMIYSFLRIFQKKMRWKDSVALLPFLCIGYEITLMLM